MKEVQVGEQAVSKEILALEEGLVNEAEQVGKCVLEEVVIIEKTLVRIWVEKHIGHIIFTGILLIIMLIASFFWHLNHADDT